MTKRRAVFLDRDGTLIKAVPRPGIYPIKKPSAPWRMREVRMEPRLEEAMKIFKDLGYLRVMITNQPDVAYGYLPLERWQKIFTKVLAIARPDWAYACPHPKQAGCACRKPKPGMLLQAADDLNIDLSRSFMIGDTDADINAGKAAGCKTILIAREYNKEWREQADFLAPSLLDATVIV